MSRHFELWAWWILLFLKVLDFIFDHGSLLPRDRLWPLLEWLDSYTLSSSAGISNDAFGSKRTFFSCFWSEALCYVKEFLHTLSYGLFSQTKTRRKLEWISFPIYSGKKTTHTMLFLTRMGPEKQTGSKESFLRQIYWGIQTLKLELQQDPEKTVLGDRCSKRR